MNRPLLRMQEIRKQYPGVLALADVTFELQAGEVHCLVGENGAGKSTLMKILSGALTKDSGSVFIAGKEVAIASPADAQHLGIGMIYQDYKLIPDLCVAENILLGREPRRGRSLFIDFARLHELASEILSQLGEDIPTATLVRDLSSAQQEMVEIAKALSRKVRIIAMDEPSAALTEKERKNLFGVIRRLKSEGVGIIYVSHRLEEIFEIGDTLTVLRDGKTIHTCPVAEADRRSLVRWMVGRELENEYPKADLVRGEEILRLEGVSTAVVKNVSLSLYRGEVFGMAGLVGAGRSELARTIFGADPVDAGKIIFEGKEIRPRSPREAIDLGIGLLTEDRNKYGLIMEMGVRENITLANLQEVVRKYFIRPSLEEEVGARYIEELKIKTPTSTQAVEHLSGGNRQKVILARWLFTESKLLIFDEPTAGIDVGIKYEIYNLINRLAANGIGVIVISSDLPELLGICDRIAVLWEGKLTGILSRSEATQEAVMTLATGGVPEAHAG
jgi:ribose transport system ATP-binding protein